ncbi:MAG: Crp/Fnr family transcriptional regulator [Terriglobales bacterium]
MNRSAEFQRNTILSILSRGPDFAAIARNLTVRSLIPDATVQEANELIRAIHFPLSGMLSSVVEMANGGMVEICCVGCSGMVNWEALIGQKKSRFRHFIQVAGDVASISAPLLMPYLTHPVVSGYISRITYETARNAACNCVHHVDERLARWLLIAADKVESDEMGLTQEFLAMMLGARRATVTIAAGKLQQAGLIRYRRGRVHIINREGLIGASCECYEAIASVAKHRAS